MHMPSCHACTAMIPEPEPWTAIPSGWAVRGDRHLHACPLHRKDMPCGGGPRPQSLRLEIPDLSASPSSLFAKISRVELLVLWIYLLAIGKPLVGTALVLTLWLIVELVVDLGNQIRSPRRPPASENLI